MPAAVKMAAAARQARSQTVLDRAKDVLASIRQVFAEGKASSFHAIAAELQAHGMLTMAIETP